jgi:hypothetical protein
MRSPRIILARHDIGVGDLGDRRPLLPYTLRHSNLPLHSPLKETRKPRLRTHQLGVGNNLVSDSEDTTTVMSGVMPDPEDKSTKQKLDFLMDAMNRMLG